MADERKATDLLEEALKVFKERGDIYGDAVDHYSQLADLQTAFLFREHTARDVVMRNVLEKLDRVRRAEDDSETFRDSILDAINYLAIMWEVS